MSGLFSSGPVLLYRIGNSLHRKGLVRVGQLFTFVNRLLFATVVPSSARIGERCVLGYAGLGIVIHKDARIGDRVHICQNVTIGRHPGKEGVPTIEDDVYVGPGAVISGKIVIGRGASIGANAVVLKDVPAGAVAVGVPARVIETAQVEG